MERSQRTDLDEFYSTVDIKDPDLPNLLSQWQLHYNWFRSHSSLKGKAPIDIVTTLFEKTPFGEDVEALYNPSKERIKVQNYWVDCQLNK